MSMAVMMEAAWTVKRITKNAGISANPDIAVRGQNIYLVWQDHSDVSYNRIYFTKSRNGGATWFAPKVISNGSYYCNNPKIAVSDSERFVVWSELELSPQNDTEIYFAESTDGGNTWLTPMRLSNNPGDSLYPDIAVDGSNVYVAWEDKSPQTTTSISGGRRTAARTGRP